MFGLTSASLGRACEIFLSLAYPEGTDSIPQARRAFLCLGDNDDLNTLARPPLGQVLASPRGGVRGYAFRLGSATYPHLKMQVTDGDGRCPPVFAVDTHDAMQLEASHPEAARWKQMQIANRELKQRIEKAWEAAGLLTFNGLLRQQLDLRA